jgi:type II secretory pathway component PulM
MNTPIANAPSRSIMTRLSLSRLSAAFHGWFAARAPRERQLLRAASLLLPIVVAWAMFDWARSEQQRLDVRLPAAQASFERMQEDAAELARLRTLPPPTAIAPPALAAAARAAGDARGLSVSVDVRPEGLMVSGKASLPVLVDWLASIQADLRLRPVRLKMAAAASGQFELLLQPFDDAGQDGG